MRGSPFSAGTVTISPRNSKAALAPEGEIAEFLTCRDPLTYRGRASTRSLGTPIVSFVARPLAGSNRCR